MNDHPPILGLDMEKLGQTLVNALEASALAGHAHVAGTMRDYIKRDAVPPEAQFVRDLFTRHTDDIVTEWFGDTFTMSAYTAYELGATLAAGIDRYAATYTQDAPLPRPEDLQKETTDGS